MLFFHGLAQIFIPSGSRILEPICKSERCVWQMQVNYIAQGYNRSMLLKRVVLKLSGPVNRNEKEEPFEGRIDSFCCWMITWKLCDEKKWILTSCSKADSYQLKSCPGGPSGGGEGDMGNYPWIHQSLLKRIFVSDTLLHCLRSTMQLS